MTRTILFLLWIVLAAVPFLWWLRARRSVDIWQAMPVPAALLSTDGEVRRRAGPDTDITFTPVTALPARGRVVRTRGRDGTPLAISGVRGGAVAVALPVDPVGERRDKVLAELGARLAHDINTPLGAIHGHLDLIGHEHISEPARQSVRTCQRELTRLQTTAQDLLTFTRLRAGGSRRSRCLVGALVEEAVAGLLDRADELGATLTVEVPAERVAIDAAETDLVRAIRNLIINAMTHGLGDDRSVRVTADAAGDTVTIAVFDSGPGLTQQQLVELAEPLRRGEGTTASGSGLGLAIVTEVLAAHGSSLEPATGESGVAFTLPRAQA